MKLNLVSIVIVSTRRTTARLRSAVSPRAHVSRRWTRCAALGAVLFAASLCGSSVAVAQDVKSAAAGKVLIFRNIPSWNRSPDFEDALRALGSSFDVKKSSEMKNARMSDYRLIVVPGAQWETGYYADFAQAARAFDEFVQGGGILLLELNGAESEGITIPGGASMVRHAGTDNLIIMTGHPAVAPLAQKPRITANLASHGYLAKTPANALIIATVTTDDGTPDKGKPTYVEYSLGKGKVIAACQCFHDRDNSGRGPLMPAVLTYAMAGKWYLPK